MSLLQAIVYGLIQGLTEFLPISSTAHIRVVPAFFGWEDPGAAFTAVIQIGTLLAALLYFRADIIRLTIAWVRGLLTGRPLGTPDAKMAWMIVVGTVPIVVFGLALKKYITGPWRSLYVIAAAAIVLSLILAAAEGLVRWRQRQQRPLRSMPELGWGDAVGMGLAQAVALIPGASRSGVTITAGLFLGEARDTAARFSFLLSLPAVFAAGVYELYKERHELLATQESVVNLVAATVVAGVVGYASIAFLLAYLRSHTTWVFIVYRLALGGLILWLLAGGQLQP
jgi:undecaprenyl-diphosphatase